MAEITAVNSMEAPKIRLDIPWVYSARGCVDEVADLIPTIKFPAASSTSPSYRVNVGGSWSVWEIIDSSNLGEFGWELTLDPIEMAGAGCTTVQVTGTAIYVGEYEFETEWLSSDEGSLGVVTFATLEVVPTTTSTSPPEFVVEEGVSCLGSGSYEVRIVSRKTKFSSPTQVGEDIIPYSGNWSRTLNATSDASIRITTANTDGSYRDCCETIRQIQPLRHELEIYRNRQLVWAGPIIDVKSLPKQNEVEVTAKDLSTWWARRFLLQDFISRQADLATIFENYVKYTTIADDYGLDVETVPTGILGDRTVDKDTVLDAANEINELDRTGVDWVVTNRTAFVGGITINGQDFSIPTVFTDESFSDPPTVRKTATGMGNDVYVKGRTVVGRYGGADASDGVLVQLKKTEYSIEDQGSADAAAKSMWERAHEPLVYLEGDNALASTAEVDIQELVPGVMVRANLSGGGCVPFSGRLRLERVATNFTPGGEEVTVYMQPIGQTADG